MHRKFDIRRYLTAFFIGIFAVAGSVVAVNAPAKAVTGDTSTVDYALSFNGSSDYLEATEGSQYTSRAIYTVQTWVNPAVVACASTNGCAIASHDGDWWIGIKDGKFQYLVYQAGQGSNTGYVDTGISATANTWSHLTLVRNDTALTFYVNGIAVKTSTITSGRSTYTGYPIKVGAHYGNHFTGQIDELKIWSAVRDATAIATDMHTYQTSASTTANLIAYFDFNEGGTNSTVNNRVGRGANLAFANLSPTINYVDVKITTKAAGKTILKFPRSYLTPVGGWSVPASVTRADVLVVGGGGAGGLWVAGGGGAGEVDERLAVTVTGGSTQKITVGAGGVGGRFEPTNASDTTIDLLPSDGQESFFGESINAYGGGRGSSWNQDASAVTQRLIGSSGGASGSPSNNALSTGLQGYAGGAAAGGVYPAGGGGGAGGVGGNASAGVSGNGGVGKTVFVASAASDGKFGGGGGGGTTGSGDYGSGGTPGTGSSGGGDGADPTITSSPATEVITAGSGLANTGSGGGGAAGRVQSWFKMYSGSGGSGIVVVAYAATDDNYLSFSGSGQYASKSGAQVIPATGGFTVEAWIKPVNDAALSAAVIVSQGNTNTNRFYFKRTNTGSLIALRDGGAEITCANVPENNWVHVAVSLDGTNMRCFVNGVNVKEVSYTANSSIGTGFYVGQYSVLPNSTNTLWKGGIDQVKIWNTAITDAAIISRSMHMHADSDATGTVSGLTDLFDFNEPSGSTLDNSVGSNSLTITGAPTRTAVVSSVVSGEAKRYTFDRSVLTGWGGWLYPDGTKPASALIVAGGGGAGKPGNPLSLTGGAGGAGAVYPISKITFPTTAIPVIVGLGGRGSSSSTEKGTTGGNSKLGTLLVGGGSGGNSFQYVGSRGAAPGGSGFIAGGNGGGGRQENGTSTAGYALGDTAGAASNQTFNGLSFTALAGVAGGNDDTDSGSGGLGGQSIVRTSSISGSSVEYGKRGSYLHWGESRQGNATPGSGGALNYSYGGTITTNPSDNGGDGFTGQIVIATAVPILNYNFSDRNSTHDGTATVTNLGSNAGYSASKFNTPTHNYVNGTLNFTGNTYSNGSYVDVADISTSQFSSGITVDFEADFGATAENWERILDFGVSGPSSSNMLVSRLGTSADLGIEIYDGSTSQGTCKVVNGIPSTAQMIRWTISLDGTNCKVWKDGVAQTTSTASVESSYSYSVTSAFAKLPKNGVTWAYNYLAKSNWSADDSAKMAIRSFRLYAAALTAAEVGEITYRTVNFDANYSGSTAPSSRYTSGKTTLQSAPVRTGYTFNGWYDNSTAANGSLVGSSSAEYTPSSTPVTFYADWVSAMPSVNVNFDELNFDYANVVHVVGTNGKSLNNKVLFLNVTTKGGVQVDALVTTQTLSNATIANYESGTGAGGANSYFQADVDIAAINGYAEFKFDFYQHGVAGSSGNPCTTSNTSCTGATKVKLQNVNVSAIDIDYNQWNDFTAVESYTVAGNSQTKLKECVIPGSGTCTARTAPSTYPADMRFQGSADTARTNDPVDMAIVTYAEIETFRIKFGRSAAGKPNYYGVAFKALSWGVQTPASVGGTTYTISYNANSATGNVPTSNTGVVGSNVTLPGAGTLTKTGFTFAGWNTAADGTGTTYSAANVIQMPQGGMTLYAKWTANQYMLIYKLYGGLNGPATEMRATGAVANLSSTQPTRDGAVFDSWNTAADGTGTTYASGASFTMPGANTTLHAMYTTATGTIAYNANNGSSAPASTTGTSGTNVAAAAAGSMTRSNYTFSGWNTAANGSGTDYSVGANVAYPGNGLTSTLYAQWTPILYSYSYNANGGTGAPTGGSTTAGATVTIPSSTTTRTGYTFAGWTTSADGTGTVYTNGGANPSLTMPGANTVLYAKWTAITYTLAFDSNDAGAGSNPSSATGNYGANLTAAAAPTAPSGKKFNGWNTAANGSGSTYSVGGAYQITADATLYAQWVADTVNLFYSANGGSGAPTSTTASANQNTTLSGTAPTRLGFSFSGWTTAANGSGTVYGASSTFPVPGNDTTLYAKWTPIGYNFIYNANGGSGAPATVAYNMGDFVVIDNSGTTVRTGYTFAGWNTLADGTGSDYVGGQNFLMSNSNMTMYAKWASNPYTLTYNSNLGSGSPTAETRNAGSTANLSSTAPTRTGYTFNGWNTAQNGSGSSYNSSASYVMPTTNSTLYAQWTANSNAVSYNANNGSGAPSGGTFSFGSTVTVSNTAPTRTGYTFLGWNTLADGTGTNYSAADTFAMPNGSVTLYARWSILQKSVTYDANGGSGVDATSSYNYGATVTVSTAQVSRSGYSFIGWNTMADGSGTSNAAGTTFTMPGSDVTFYAIWSINAYTVYYNMNGGTGSVNPQPGNYGTSVVVSSTVPTRLGYTFSGWNTLAAGNGSDYTGGGALTIPSSNLTLYAKWTPIMYSVSFNANGGSGSPSDVTGLTAGNNTTLSVTTPVQTGYVFNGWNTAVDGSGQTYSGGQNFVVPAANTVLYAQWVANTYEIIYNANGGSGAPTPANGSTNSTVTLTSGSVTRAGYTHLGWSTNSGATTATYYGPSNLSFVVPAGNTILYAVWALADITVTYNINNGSGSTPSAVTDKYLETITLAPSSAFNRSGYTFNGWNTAADGSGSSYAAEANFVMPSADKTLYAQWSAVYYAIEYSANGGSNAPANQFAIPGATVAVPTIEPVKSGYEFNDWTQVAAGTTVTPGGTLTMPSSNVVLVANWVTAASVPSGSPATNNPSPSPSPSASPVKKKLTQTVYFKGDSAVLQTKAKQQLKALATKAVTYGYALKIQVTGRVKETADKSYDMRLSRQRAQNVANYLKTLKVKGKWVITAAGISPENKAISRRVDISIVW